MSNTAKKSFPPDTGDFISKKNAERLRDNYCAKKKQKFGDDFIQAYFFGKDKLQELLNYQEDIVGLRIYYGDDCDHDGKEDKKMVIYAVDKNGQNVLYKPKQKSTAINSLRATGDDDLDDGGALDNGLPCPTSCP